jgi:hypothetical protein
VNKNNVGAKIESSFVKIVINGSDYWINTYTGDRLCSSCSEIHSEEDYSSTFTLVGYVLINVNYTESKYLEIYSKV